MERGKANGVPDLQILDREALIAMEPNLSDDVVCAFEENGEYSVYVGESCNDGYSYIAYIDEVNSTQFLFKTDDNDVIKAVYMKGR